MLDREPRLRTIVRINLRFVMATVSIAYGWVCWQWTSPEWWGLGLVAGLCLFAGAMHIIETIHQIVAIFARERKIDAFARQGSAVRADKMASEAALKKRGIVR